MNNLPEVFAGLSVYTAEFGVAASGAVKLISTQLLRNAHENASEVSNPPERRTSRNGKSYLKYFPHQGGLGPNMGTGNLVNSMFASTQKGFGVYTAEVGVGMVYSRSLEFGRNGVKYPFMQPALNKLVDSGQLSQIINYSFSSLRG